MTILMRVARAGFLIALLAAAHACRPDATVAPSPPVAWVGTDTLDAERLAHLLVLAQPFPLETGAVVDLVRHWQLAMALADDPGRAAGAVSDAVREAAGDAAIAQLRSARFGDATREATDRAAVTYARGELRLVGHILRRANPTARAEERTVQRRAAEAILRDLRAGADWLDANRRNEDDAARAAAGVIGLVARGELPPPLDSVAYSLAPGGLSDVIETAAGYHIVHRPRLETVRESFVRLLADRIADEQERALGAEVAQRRNASLAPVAPLRVRELALDPWAALSATDPVGSFDGGVLTGGTLAAILASLAWDARRAILEAPATDREAFAGRALIRAALRVEAEAAGSGTAADTVALHARITAQLDSIAQHVATDRADPWLSVDRYMGRLAARHVPLVMPPAALWHAMLEDTHAGFRIEPIAVGIERSRALLVAGGYARERP